MATASSSRTRCTAQAVRPVIELHPVDFDCVGDVPHVAGCALDEDIPGAGCVLDEDIPGD